ncbi:MAG: hypothetical protein HZY75_02140 [Nocardioidaceae bacterium]|nr:MAG: hypothetical protein HZY75_02140 [Nocardioidaceae bacterium]
MTTTLKDTGNLSANSLKDALNQAVTATTTLVDDLQALEAPDTEAGAAAKEDIAALANALSEQRDTFNDTIDQAPSGAAGVLTAAAAAATLLTTMSTSVTSTFASLQSLEGGEELKQAFESADECQDFRSGS